MLFQKKYNCINCNKKVIAKYLINKKPYCYTCFMEKIEKAIKENIKIATLNGGIRNEY